MQLSGKSCKLDPLPFSIFIKLLDCILLFLHLTLNTSLRNGVLPASEKLAFFMPILKKSGLDPYPVSHYNPVSNRLFVLKLIEHLACRQIIIIIIIKTLFRLGHVQKAKSLSGPAESTYVIYATCRYN